jgi:DNA-binding XRE family transcriptional regulator
MSAGSLALLSQPTHSLGCPHCDISLCNCHKTALWLLQGAGSVEKKIDAYVIGRRIRQHRKTMGMRQITLARAIGFTDPNTIKNYEMGRLPRLQVLARLAGAPEVTIEWILVGGKK